METDTGPNEGLMWPILSLPQLKVDSDEENASKTLSWFEERKLFVSSLESKEEKGSSDDEFNESAPIGRIKTEKEELLDQKESNLCLEGSSYIKETRTLNKVQAELNDGNCSRERPIKSEFIKQEELHIKEEENDEDVLKSKKNCVTKTQPKTIQHEKVYVTSKSYAEEKLNGKMSGNQSVSSYQCPECPYSTVCKSYLKNHSIKHKKPEEVDWYNCQECPYRTSIKSNLKIHAEVHSSNKLLLKCSDCSYETWRSPNFKRHLMKHKPNIQWLHCPECSFKTSIASRLQYHVLEHKSDALNCTNCSYQAKTKQQFIIHQTKHESMNKWHSCSLCPFKTYNKSGLKKHSLRRHSIDPKTKQIVVYKCIQCSYQSGDEYQVKTHQLTHDQNSWLQCPDCSFKTAYKNRFKEHQVRHQGKKAEGWHRCPECIYKTAHKSNLRTHINSHKSVKKIRRFECSQCSFKTAHKYYLKRHQLKHKEPEEIEWFCCYECPFKSVHKRSLQKHIFTKHKNTKRPGLCTKRR